MRKTYLDIQVGVYMDRVRIDIDTDEESLDKTEGVWLTVEERSYVWLKVEERSYVKLSPAQARMVADALLQYCADSADGKAGA